MFNGVVIIYLKSNSDIPFLVNTTLHEVMHYMQMRLDRQYKLNDELTNAHGYLKNPFEVQAREFASIHCEPCLKYLESKQLIKRS